MDNSQIPSSLSIKQNSGANSSVGFHCGCKTTNEGTARYPREMLLPANMCEEHRAMHQAYHADSAAERAQARARLEQGAT